MEVSVIGTSHRTAPVEIREKFALGGDLAQRLLRAVGAEKVLGEAMVLDTCNRTELYFVSQRPQDPLDYFLGHIARLKGACPEPDASVFYRHDGAAAVAHLFRVAAALDSQIVGEHQILGQAKRAYRVATQAGTSRFLLNKLLHWAFRVGKRVQSETELGRGTASVAQAAVDLACQIFSDLTGKAVLLVGAGQTAELAAHRLIGRGVRRVVVANRTLARARQLAADLAEGRYAGKSAGEETAGDEDSGREQIGGPVLPQSLDEQDVPATDEAPPPAARPATQAVALADIPKVIADVDLVISSTGSGDLVLTGDGVAETLRRCNRLFFMVDIAVPRDVDPALGRLPNVFLYNMNDLDSVVARNIERRRQEIPRAEAIVEYETGQFVKWYDSLGALSTIKLLQQRVGLLREAEIKRYGGKFSPADRKELERFTRSLCNKILHPPTAFLRELSEEMAAGDRLAAVDIIRRMFDLAGLEDST